MRYPLKQVGREVAFIAYHFHWSKEEILRMSHLERRRWVDAVSHLNKEINEAAEERSRELL